MPIDLAVTGAVPTSLSGQYVRISEGVVHAVRLAEGRAPSYRNSSIPTGATDVVAFGSSILAFGDGQLAHELGAELDAFRRVDLAGAQRTLSAQPKVDPVTGELHLLSFASDPAQLHVRVSPGGLTRNVRSLDNAPSRIRQLELTRDHVVLLADGFVGLTDRAGLDPMTSWFPIDTDARHIAAAHDHGEAVVVYVTGPSLVRWTLQRRPTTAHSQVLDATPHAFASSNRRPPGAAHRFLWTVGSGVVHKHDLFAGTRHSHEVGRGRNPGGLVFVADPRRRSTEDGGWLVGFVHDETAQQTDFVVLDAHVIERPAVALAHIPRRVPIGAHGAWIPTVQI
jgi:carotenoid cleavage dioxygenase-like enzyme